MLMNKLNGQEENSDIKQQQQTKSDSPLKHQEAEEEAQLLHNPNSQLYTTTSSSIISSSSTNNQTANIRSINNNNNTHNLQPVNNMASSATSTSNATSAVSSSGAGNGASSHAPNGSVSSSTNSNSSASSTTSSTGLNSNDSNAYFHQSFTNIKTVDLNNNSNLSTNNNNSIPGASSQHQQHSTHLGQYQSHLGQQQNSLVNAYSFLNNPYLNGGLLNSNGQGQLSAQNQAQLLSNFYNGNNLANFNLQPNALPPHLSNQSHAPSLHSTGILNMGNPASLLNASQLVGAFSDEHQAYEYLHQLLEEKEKLKELFNEPFNIMLPISAKLLDEEVSRIRVNLFQLGGKESVMLPEPVGQVIQMTEKLYVPVKDHPEFNFVGRILGPRGMTAKQLEQETGCKIMVRGKGSMRDKAKEDQMKGKPNWEHLSDELHVLLTVEDTKNRCDAKLKRAAEEIKRLLVPAAEGEDELKKKQLMELAIINGTYRDGSKIQQNKMNQILIPQHAGLTTAVSHTSQLRSPPNQMGQPLILSPRLQNTQMLQNPGQTQQFFTTQGGDQTGAGASGQFIYATMPTLYSEQQSHLLNPQSLLEYPTGGVELSQAGSMKPGRFSAVGAPTMRAHPYARVI